MKTNALAWIVSAAVSVVAVGCGDDGEQTPSKEPENKVAAVKQALERPSGTVDESTVADIHDRYEKMLSGGLAFDAITLAFEHADGACSTPSSDAEETFDVSCATSGSVSGSISMKASGTTGANGTEASVELVLHEVCDDDACVSGTVTAQTSVTGASVSVTVAYSADITANGETQHVFFGTETNVPQSSVLAKVAIWDAEGESFVVESAVDDGGASFSIEGENGTFRCSVDEAGGHCTGSGEIDF